MNFRSVLILFSFFINFAFSQNSYSFFNLSDESEILITSVANGGHKNITVNIINGLDEDILVNFPAGGFFNNENNSEQDLVNLFHKELEVSANGTSFITLSTACANPGKAAPRIGRINWSYGYDQKIGVLLDSYHSNRAAVEFMTGPQHHNTAEKRHNFLQMFVWVYYDASKKQILDFATKYIFEGDRRAAENYVDLYYPIAKLFIDTYKRL